MGTRKVASLRVGNLKFDFYDFEAFRIAVILILEALGPTGGASLQVRREARDERRVRTVMSMSSVESVRTESRTYRVVMDGEISFLKDNPWLQVLAARGRD